MATTLNGRRERLSRKATREAEARQRETERTRMVRRFLSKLEANPGMSYSMLLSAAELTEAKAMMRAAVSHAVKTAKPPKTFVWRGRRYPLLYSNLGRVAIASQSGRGLLWSGYFAI